MVGCEGLPASEHRPQYSGVLGRQRHGRLLPAAALLQLMRPQPDAIALGLAAQQGRFGSLHQQHAKVAVALACDSPQTGLAPAGVL